MVDATDIQSHTDPTAAALEILSMLTERYPATFRHDGEPPKPLAIGIGNQLITDLDLAPTLVHAAMRLYTRRRAYQLALAKPGAMRVDLQGEPTEPVAPEHQDAARTRQAIRQGQHPPTSADNAPALTWDDLTVITQALATRPAGEARTMKLTLIGRPGKVETRAQVAVFRMQGKTPGSMPKGLPPMPNAAPLTWTVMVDLRQWNRVKDSLATHVDDQLIIEGYPLMQGTNHVLMAQSCISIRQQRAQKQAQQAQAGQQTAAETV